MSIHEFGQHHPHKVLLLHPSVVMWDYFEAVIPLLEPHVHVIVPALPGYDPERPGDFTSIEDIARELELLWLEKGWGKVSGIYGCSMGGSIVIRLLANRKLPICHAIIDGGITPYQLPWLVTRFIALKDFLMIYLGKLGGIKLLERAFATDSYSPEDLRYIEAVLKKMSAKTIWRTFDSCNNYSMPEPITSDCEHIEYWFSAAEENARKHDIAYVRQHFPQATFRRFDQVGHGGLAVLKPELLAAGILRLTPAP
ncbi:MAG: alpha/beta hydrolase [Bacillota bacterium]|nr:alpha/beta hydrolase [Bacillota bacterium]